MGSVRQGRIVVLAVWAGALKVGLAGGNSASSLTRGVSVLVLYTTGACRIFSFFLVM